MTAPGALRARRRPPVSAGRVGRLRIASDEGSILPLVVACAALALAVVLVATAATSLYVERTRLYSVADAAALVGAEAFELDQVHVENGALAVALDSADVRAAVLAYLDERSPREFESLECDEAVGVGGSARVTLSAVWRPPVVAPFVPDGISLSVTSTARSVLQE